MIFSFSIVDGGYTQWTAWSACPVTCGGGTFTRTRTCTAPTPNSVGRTCLQQGLGGDSETIACNTDPCPSKCRYNIAPIYYAGFI